MLSVALFIVMLSVIMLSVVLFITLSDIMFVSSFILLYRVFLCLVLGMLSVKFLNVIILTDVFLLLY